MPLIIKDEYPEKLFREDGKRLDGRDKNELRPIKMEVGNGETTKYIVLFMDLEKYILTI